MIVHRRRSRRSQLFGDGRLIAARCATLPKGLRYGHDPATAIVTTAARCSAPDTRGATKHDRVADRGAPAVSQPFVQASLGASGPVIQRKAACACGGDCPRCRGDADETPTVQTRLAVSVPADPLEQEAEHTADEVMRMPEKSRAKDSTARDTSPRRGNDPSGRPREFLHAKSMSVGNSGPRVAPSTVHDALQSRGDPLDATTQQFFEPRFRHDFNDVRVHTGAAAEAAASGIGALAFTTGKDIVFGAGQFSPDTEQGKRLIAHELTHVVQQSTAASPLGVQRYATSDCDPAQATLIATAVTTAQTNLRTARTALAGTPLGTDVENALWLYFRDSTAATATAVNDSLGRILSAVDQLTYECESDCDERMLGYTRLGTMLLGVGNIHLCLNNLDNDAAKVANTMIHELAHYALLATDSAGYFEDDCRESETTVAAGTSSRLGTADSYSCFVKNWVGGSSADRTETRGDLTGANIAGIQQTPPGAIDLNAPSPRRPLFAMRLTRGPIAIIPGVSYRWSLRDPADNAYLMTDTSHNDLQQFRPASESVLAMINTPTRDLLKQRGITSGRVICRATSPVFGDRVFEVAVTFS